MKPIEAASEHFTIIHWEGDSRVIEGMLEVLENSYNRITSFLQVELLVKCVLHVYPDINKLHEGIGRTGAPNLQLTPMIPQVRRFLV